MKIYVDIDNTICITEGTDYENSKPIKERIRVIFIGVINDITTSGFALRT